MAASSKAQFLTDVFNLLKKRYKLGPRNQRLTVLEAVVYGISHEGTTREHANQALARFKDEFFDWNEVRVSSLREIEGILAGVPEPSVRAQQVRRFLRQLFSRTYGFTLEPLTKKPLKEAVKALQEYDAGQSDYVLATVIQLALGGHALPIDAPLRRTLERLGLAAPQTKTEALRAAIERIVPKNRGLDLAELLEELAHDTCIDGTPQCSRCALAAICPTAKALLPPATKPKPSRGTAPPKAKAAPKPPSRPTPDGAAATSAKSRSAPKGKAPSSKKA